MKPSLGKRLLPLSLLIFPAAAACQGLPPLNVFLDRLDEYARLYRAALPSLECDEQITSQALNKKGKVTWEVKAQSTLREIRPDNPYDPFTERRQFKSINERRARPGFHPSQMPYFVTGGFADMAGFKMWQQRECFDYSLTSADNGHTVRLEMALKQPAANASCARLPDGFHRIVIADPETGRILHTERTIAPGEAELNSEAYFGGIDYAPQQLGDQIFWVPSRFDAHDARNSARMSAVYSNYHRYTGELRILPDRPTPGSGQNH